ncbi:diacylglycerol/lipid kinase family protein [Paenibacillus sacheonensis]|uniref:YegS/Rv2252/BmrU family lipid kinase n=1 Tax=Paenibacillus sacheonensis TaxID=742054 RepID=A0A7X4YSA6_9BACL|nr:diacylglycerol kinase family protein [Paenibacillus sacheonensis]MBM7566993.1 diacylglycerol kinase (ATP) [Paenibacillus sacheonensis]NBC71615.1 YegS/Rv2252/BmrU family lipid kinase [Paenibacillus sacheonensis]
MSKHKKSKRVKLIVNPGSGNAAETPGRVERAVSFLQKEDFEVDVAYAKPKRKGCEIARKAVKDGYKTVIVMGGDGTIVEVIRGLADSKTRLGIIVGGTMNDIAGSLGIPEDPEEACALIVKGHTRKIDLGRVKTKKHKKFYFVMVASIGLTATMYPKVKKVPKGRLSGLTDAFKTFMTFESKPTVRLTLDDDSKIKVETMMVNVANTPLIASKNLVAPDASMGDGLLDISVYPEFSKADVLQYFKKTAKENLIPDDKLQRYRARKIKIKSEPELEIAADGIPLGKGKATIKICAGALRIFAPKEGAGAEKPAEKCEADMPAPVSPYVVQVNG